MRSLNLTATLIAISLLTACGGKSPGAYEAAAKSAEAPATAEKSEAVTTADAHWAERGDAAKLSKALSAYETALANNPGDRYVLTQLTRGWYFYGDAHSTDKDVKIERWGKAIEYGKQCLALNEGFKAKIDAGEKETEAVAASSAEDVPCLYWTASALGKWGKIQGLSKVMKHIPTVKAYIGRAEELDPEYFHFGPARYWGAYYSALPSFAGQDLDKSLMMFEQSITGAPGYLGTYVLRAEGPHVLRQDAVAFKADIDLVLAADPNAVEGIEPENAMEQAKAQRLLESMPELFDKEALAKAGM